MKKDRVAPASPLTHPPGGNTEGFELMSILLQNRAAVTFRELYAAFQADTRAPRTEELAAEFAAVVACEPHTVCVGVFEPKTLRRVYGLAWTLEQYGVTLRSKARPDGTVFLYAETEPAPTPLQFMGAVVQERRSAVAA